MRLRRVKDLNVGESFVVDNVKWFAFTKNEDGSVIASYDDPPYEDDQGWRRKFSADTIIDLDEMEKYGCPECGSDEVLRIIIDQWRCKFKATNKNPAGYKRKKSNQEKYAIYECDCGHEFDEPVEVKND